MRTITIRVPEGGRGNVEIDFPDEHINKRELLIIGKALKIEYRKKVREYRKILIQKAGELDGREQQRTEQGTTNSTGTGNVEDADGTKRTIEDTAATGGSSVGTEQSTTAGERSNRAEEIRRKLGLKGNIKGKK